jgi:anti-sigma factor RsiW
MNHTEAVSTLASERYLLEEMADAEREAFEAHYFECQECADDVRTGAVMREGAQAGFLAGPHAARSARIATFPSVPKAAGTPSAPVGRRAWYRSTALPWSIAATLALSIGYQSRQSTSGGAELGPRTLTTVTLRPASRGSVPTVALSESHAALALDLDAQGAAEVLYELRTQGSDIVMSGRAPAPAVGSPLLLVIPSFTLTPQQRYILSVSDASNPRRLLTDYHFLTAP